MVSPSGISDLERGPEIQSPLRDKTIAPLLLSEAYRRVWRFSLCPFFWFRVQVALSMRISGSTRSAIFAPLLFFVYDLLAPSGVFVSRLFVRETTQRTWTFSPRSTHNEDTLQPATFGTFSRPLSCIIHCTLLLFLVSCFLAN
jgi:hypothetical protein